ncbi:hypothetical protein V6N11_065162 [Hibiscus sabdariffa]|uniref:Uncharacterized protein n=2 Tax=Hibiscus sabdariffa TaxID=183260 RepID=A0ABR2A938_9ROSI
MNSSFATFYVSRFVVLTSYVAELVLVHPNPFGGLLHPTKGCRVSVLFFGKLAMINSSQIRSVFDCIWLLVVVAWFMVLVRRTFIIFFAIVWDRFYFGKE